jgi:Fe2+ transport system protein FeoA
VPNTLEGKKCVIVHIDMRDDNVMAWDFVMGFARDNQLQVIQTQQP